MKNKILLISLVMLFGCVPPPIDTESEDIEVYANLEDCEPCPLLLNFASSNYQNRDWQGAIDNYNQLLQCNCGKVDPENTFKYMAYSYQQLGRYDSAAYIFKQGLKYTPEDIDLLKMAGENSGRLSNYEDQIYYFDKILSYDEGNLKVLEMLSDVYRDNEMYEEQVNILDIWLKYDPTSKNANAEKKAAFSALGKDESDVDRERWESEPSNIQYGISYLESLAESGSQEKLLEVGNELLIYEKYNIIILKKLAKAYSDLYKEKEALETYLTLAKVDPSNYEVAIEISKIYINKENFSEALDWAEKSINISGESGKSIFQRAEVYYSTAEFCSSDPLSFWDKVVYEISWEDYTLAVNKGYSQARNRKDFVSENFITTINDWFMRPDGEKKVSPQGDCYAWINREINRKK